MAKKVQLEVDIKGGDSVGKAAEKTKSLKQELRELKQELASGNLTGKAFDEAAKRAGKLQDSIGDVNQRVKNLASDTSKLDGFVSLATGIAGGFAAAQGAMALFGSENEDLQKSLVKIQGAVALLNGVQAVANTLNKESAASTNLNIKQFNILTFVKTRYAAAVGTTTGALKLMRIAGAALGIGLIVTAIGLLIGNFDKLKNMVLKFVPQLAQLGEVFTNVKNAIMDFLGFSSEAERQQEKSIETDKAKSKSMQREIDLMEAQGASAEAIYKKKKELMELDLKALKIAKEKAGASQEETDAYDDALNAIAVLDAQETKRKQDLIDKDNTKAAEKRKAAHDKKVEQQKKDAEELKKLIADETQKLREQQFSDQAKEISALQLAAQEKMKIAKGNAEAEKLIRENLSKDIATLNEKYAKEEAEKKKEKDKILTDLIEQRRVDDLSVREKELFDIQDKYAKEAELAKGHADLLAEIETDKNKALADKKLEFAKQDAEAQKQIDTLRLESMVATASAASQLLNQVAGKNKALAISALAIEKGAAIASVIINAGKELSANAAASALNPLNAVTGGAAGAAQLLKMNALTKIRTGINIASIAATGIQGAKSISAGGGSGGGSVQPPNIRGSQTTNEPTSQPETKVFVTETDIRSVTRKVDGIFTQATIQ
jgi:hypothetical protein